jgi:hypothetical protein
MGLKGRKPAPKGLARSDAIYLPVAKQPPQNSFRISSQISK